MRIFFDVSCLDRDRASGVVIYARHLGFALSGLKSVQLTGGWRISRRRQLEIIKRNWSGRLMPYLPLCADWQLGSRFEVFHGPDYEIARLHKLPKVVTVHDFSFYEDGFGTARGNWKRKQGIYRLLKRRKPEAVIAVSEFTRQKVLERFPEYEGRVFSVWHGADHLLIPANRAARPIPYPYYLFVGNLETRKNIVGLIKAFDILKSRPEHKETRLILAGMAGYGFDKVKAACKAAVEPEHILLPGYLSNIQLVTYYQWAEGFVYPSHYEGFGFPILEAMRLGCPVVTSRGTATAEVADDAAVLIDPKDSESIAQAMARVAEDSGLRQSLIAKGSARGRSFTWAKCAEETYKVYEFAARSR